jgi:hypothetical protein
MAEVVALTETRMTINVQSDREYDEIDDDIWEEVLRPFTFLRHVADVKVSGMSGRYARYLRGRLDEKSRLTSRRRTSGECTEYTIFVEECKG